MLAKETMPVPFFCPEGHGLLTGLPASQALRNTYDAQEKIPQGPSRGDRFIRFRGILKRLAKATTCPTPQPGIGSFLELPR